MPASTGELAIVETVAGGVAASPTTQRRSRAWASFKADRGALFGAGFIILILLVCVGAPLLAPYDPTEQSLQLRRAPPSPEHPLGMDELGRDILSRLIFGARNTLLAAVFAVSIGFAIGLPPGLMAGFYGRYTDAFIMRGVDALLAFPAFLLAIAIVAVLGPSLTHAALAIGIASVPVYARLSRGAVLGVRHNDYVLSARAVGAGDTRIMVRHVLPAILPPVIILATLSLATAILSVAGLSFLGMGAQPPEPEWGAMLGSGRSFIREAPHITIVPGVAIMLLVVAFNLVGDGLRDALDPRVSHR